MREDHHLSPKRDSPPLSPLLSASSIFSPPFFLLSPAGEKGLLQRVVDFPRDGRASFSSFLSFSEPYDLSFSRIIISFFFVDEEWRCFSVACGPQLPISPLEPIKPPFCKIRTRRKVCVLPLIYLAERRPFFLPETCFSFSFGPRGWPSLLYFPFLFIGAFKDFGDGLSGGGLFGLFPLQCARFWATNIPSPLPFSMEGEGRVGELSQSEGSSSSDFRRSVSSFPLCALASPPFLAIHY